MSEPQFPTKLRNAHKNFGTLSVLCGCSLSLLEILAIVMKSGFVTRGSGLWCGVAFLLSGGLCISVSTARRHIRRLCLASSLAVAATLFIASAAVAVEAATLMWNKRVFELTRMLTRSQAYHAVYYIGVAKTAVEGMALCLALVQLVCLMRFHRRLLAWPRAAASRVPAAVTDCPMSLPLPPLPPRTLPMPPPYSAVGDPPPPSYEVAMATDALK